MMREKIYVIQSDKNMIPDVVSEIISNINHVNKINEDYLYKIKLVLNEMIANSIIHGNCSCEDKKVTIRMKANRKSVQFRITDQGSAFNGFNETCSNLLKEDNRGVLICQNLCDEISYKFTSGVGNSAIIKFYKVY